MKYLSLCLVLNTLALPYALASDSRLLATGAVSTIEGSAGGGIVPMALLSSYASREESGATAFISRVQVSDYNLSCVGASWTWHNRIEVSYAEQRLQHEALSTALGVDDTAIRQSMAGIKIRLYGDALYSIAPQISVGVLARKNQDFFIPSAAGAKRDSDAELYLAGTKVLLGKAWGRNLLLNGALRYTRANQTGLVGFGGDANDNYQWLPEFSGGIFANGKWLFGAEYKRKPDNLSFAREDDWKTVFAAWFPNKKIAVVAAYVDLGEVATFKHQEGAYVSVQATF